MPSGTIQKRIHQGNLQTWMIVKLAVKRFSRIGGTRWAQAFAYNAFFSLFPLMVLLVTIASLFIERDQAGIQIIAYIETYVPLSGDMQTYIFDTIAGVINARSQAGIVALLLLVWVTLQCFTTLISATNRAWGARAYSWWKLPLKSLLILGTTAAAILLGIGTPMLISAIRELLFPDNDFRSWVYTLMGFLIPWLIVYLGLSAFYKFAPRRPTRFSEIWLATLATTFLLLLAESLFVIYLENFASLNVVYGTFGGIMALLLWIYLLGCIFIFGACLSAAKAEWKSDTS